MAFHFLNIDLLILAREKPEALLRFFKKHAIVLYAHWVGSEFEIIIEPDPPGRNTVNRAATAYRKMFAEMPLGARSQWDKAAKRQFDFGYDLVGSDRIQRIEVPKQFGAFIADVNATLVMTIYDENHSELGSRQR
jgi:hypothetical protein